MIVLFIGKLSYLVFFEQTKIRWYTMWHAQLDPQMSRLSTLTSTPLVYEPLITSGLFRPRRVSRSLHRSTCEWRYKELSTVQLQIVMLTVCSTKTHYWFNHHSRYARSTYQYSWSPGPQILSSMYFFGWGAWDLLSAMTFEMWRSYAD